jgi:citrate synthase
MDDVATLEIEGESYKLPIVIGHEADQAIDISRLRAETGYLALDEGYANTAPCRSAITFIDGDRGILRYRGIPIEQIAERSSFLETAWLVINGELPTASELQHWRDLLVEHEMLHEGLYKHFDGFPAQAHPMAILSAMINAAGCYTPDLARVESAETFLAAAARLLSQIRTIAAASYKTSIGQPIVYPRPELPYCANFLHMMFSVPFEDYDPDPDVVAALDLILRLHADHEQNCSTSTVRMVASGGANLYASCAAGVCALWGPLHGGANTAVVEMLQHLHDDGITVASFIDTVKDKRSKVRLMGFGHRVYKRYDPRARIIKAAADRVLAKLNRTDRLLDIAKALEEAALKDDYFKEKRLYPNVDFYSGIIMRAIGIPLNMFTVMFAIGRLPGWIANWKEVSDGEIRLYRPRQVYVGQSLREYEALDERGRPARASL